MKNDQCLQELLVYYPRNRLWNGCLSIICPHYSTQPRTQNNPFTINRYNTFTWWSIQVPHQKTAPGDMGHDYIVAKPRITLQKAMSLHTKMTQKPQIHNNHRELTHFFWFKHHIPLTLKLHSSERVWTLVFSYKYWRQLRTHSVMLSSLARSWSTTGIGLRMWGRRVWCSLE